MDSMRTKALSELLDMLTSMPVKKPESKEAPKKDDGEESKDQAELFGNGKEIKKEV